MSMAVLEKEGKPAATTFFKHSKLALIEKVNVPMGISQMGTDYQQCVETNGASYIRCNLNHRRNILSQYFIDKCFTQSSLI